MKTYVDAIPFFGFELQSNIMYSLIFFGYHYLVFGNDNEERLIEKQEDRNYDKIISISTDYTKN